MRTLVLAAGAAAVCVSVALTSCSSSTTSNSSGGTTPATTSGGGATTATSSAPSSAAAGGSSGQTARITISGFAFSGDLTVKPGEKVIVTDKDAVSHTLTGKTGNFDTGPIGGSGGTATFTAPTQPGSYALTCSFHPSMHGTLTVTG